jgi:hypothetical protein
MISDAKGQKIAGLDDWRLRAAPKGGDLQWKEGRSAYECARAWCDAAASPAGPIPPEIAELLQSHGDTRGVSLRSAIPELSVRFDKLRGEPRNSDLCALADSGSGLLAISIEAKADEPFDKLVKDVLQDAVARIAGDQRTNAVTRIQQLASALLPERTEGLPSLGDLRYQLLTAVAGTLAYAEQSKAARAVFIVHEFVTSETSDEKHDRNKADLDRFVVRLTGGAVRQLTPGQLIGPVQVPGRPLFKDAPPLYVGKAVRRLR